MTNVEAFERTLALSARTEAALLELMEQFPHSVEPFIKWAEIAENKRNFAEAIRRAVIIRSTFPRDPAGYTAGAVALARSGNHADAEALLATAIAKLGKIYPLVTTQAHLAYRAGDATLAAQRFADVRRLRPSDIGGYVWGAEALAMAGRHDEAERLLEGVVEGPLGCAIEMALVRYARCAEARQDWSEAAKRWQLLCKRLPLARAGYAGRTAALRQTGQHNDTADLINSAKKLLPLH